MRTTEQISPAAKPMFDRMSGGLKFVGSGNAAGLVGMIAETPCTLITSTQSFSSIRREDAQASHQMN
jgi:hypothetical protein